MIFIPVHDYITLTMMVMTITTVMTEYDRNMDDDDGANLWL